MTLSDEVIAAFAELATATIGRVAYLTVNDGERLTDSNGTPLFSMDGGVPAIPARAEADWNIGDGGALQTDRRAWIIRASDAVGFHEGQHLTDGLYIGRAVSVSPTPDGALARVTIQSIQ